MHATREILRPAAACAAVVLAWSVGGQLVKSIDGGRIMDDTALAASNHSAETSEFYIPKAGEFDRQHLGLPRGSHDVYGRAVLRASRARFTSDAQNKNNRQFTLRTIYACQGDKLRSSTQVTSGDRNTRPGKLKLLSRPGDACRNGRFTAPAKNELDLTARIKVLG